MTADIQDPAVAATLEHVIGHAAPYTDAELATLRALRVVGATSLADLRGCSGLEQLALVGCDVSDLAALSPLTALRMLSVLACPVTSAQGLISLQRLEELHLDFAFLDDATPLFSLPSLRRARLLGNPWSADGWQRLREHGLAARPGDAASRPIFELGAESDVELDATRRLHAFGLGLCFGSLDGLRTVLVRPGKARVPGLEFDWSVASTAGVWLDAKEDWTTDRLFDTVRDYWIRRGENSAFDFESHREFGDCDDARRWIAAEDDPGRRRLLQRFVDRFAGAVFFREDDAFHAMIERRAGVALPASFRMARKILAGAFPERTAAYRVARYAGNTPAASLTEQGIWYRPWFENYERDEGPTIRDSARVYPFALWPVQKLSVITVSLDGDQPDIYEYSEPDLFSALQSGQPATSSLYRVYSSYAELLDHIAAFKLPDGTVIEASPIASDGG